MVVKGAPDTVLAMCASVDEADGTRPLDEADRTRIRALNDALAGRPARVLAFAEGPWPDDPEVPAGLTWAGLVGMADPLRPEARRFVAEMRRAGVRPTMVTGDQAATARAIAEELDLAGGAPLRIVDAPRLGEMSPELLAGVARQTHVFSRVSARHKQAIVRALQSSGEVVGMTGDGVNDGPALKSADIGIAMGASGANLARDVANVVIRDDDLATLADAVAQGRAVYRNIRRALEFLIATNLSEIAVGIVEAAHGPGELETPMELLWINLVSDVLPGLGLALADPDPGVLDRPPRAPGEPIIPPDHFRRMALDSGTIAAATLVSHFVGLARHGPGPQTRSMTFVSLSLGQLLYTLFCQRSDVRDLQPGRLLENRALDGAVLTSAGLAVLPILVPGLRRLLGIAPLGATDAGIALAGAVAPAAAVLMRRGVRLQLREVEGHPCATS
jgi:Ca2+-transporting ATPase